MPSLAALRSAALLCAALTATGCGLIFDDPGDGPNWCDAAPEIALAPLRNPDTLLCETFGGGCDPSCGPCPLAAPQAPEPSWAWCGSTCESLGEAACAASPECRVARDVTCGLGRDCTWSFLGCFGVDRGPALTTPCAAARDGWTCSRSNGCVAYHDGGGPAAAAPSSLPAPLPFVTCAAEGAALGRCSGPVTCAVPPPACPPAHAPLIASGCYTGGCVPARYCAAG
jgi:hypothetical protein